MEAEQIQESVPATREGLMTIANEVVEREREEAEAAPAAEPVEHEAPPHVAPDKDSLTLQEWRDAKRAQSESLKAFETAPGNVPPVESEPAPEIAPEPSAPMAFSELEAAELRTIEALAEKITNAPNIPPEEVEGALKAIEKFQEKRADIQAQGFQLAAKTALEGAHVQVKAAANRVMALDGLLTNAFVQNFPEIKSQDDIARLAAENPQRATEVMKFLGEAKTTLENEVGGLQAQQAAWAENYNAWGQVQDAEFERRLEKEFPQLKDNQQRGKVAEAAIAMLNREGVSREHIAALQNGVADIPWRHSLVQTILMKAALYDQAQATRRNAIKQPVPQVVRPGVGGARQPNNYAEIAALLRKPSLTTREAARLSMLRREA